MKKFKLVKAYPGSLEIGTEVTWGNHGLTGECYEARVKAGIFRFSKETIENNPEFWQEVEEPEYEIYSFSDTVSLGVVYVKQVNGRFGKAGVFTEEECLYEYKNLIHSVKRLSDGLILTVGDTISTKITLYVDTITEFKLNDVKSSFKKGIWVSVKNGGMHIDRIDRIVKPIFTTEDGKDIFAGDKVWCVNKHSQFIGIDGSFVATLTVHFNSDLIAYFLTIEDADNYITKNKVLFTTEDGVYIYHGNEVWWITSNNQIMMEAKWTGGNKCYESNKYFSTKQAAEYYVLVNAKVLSIEDFWDFISKPGSNAVIQKSLKRLVKKRLNIE